MTQVVIPEPERDQAADRESVFGQTGSLVIALLLVVGVAFYVKSESSWVLPALRGIGTWIMHPKTSLGAPTRVPSGLLRVAAGLAISLFLAWLETRHIVRRIPALDDPFFNVGLMVVLAFSQLALVGVWEIALRTVSIWPFVGVACALGVILLTSGKSTSALPQTPLHNRCRKRVLSAQTGLLMLVVAVAGLCILHATTQPITEFDSLIYHAELPKLWFHQAPRPSIQYGPSIGMEISANYPPLWPALGLSVYEIAGVGNDLYVKLLSPVLFVALLAITFGASRRLASARVARWSVLLLLGTPILIFYAMWPTNYMLLTVTVTLALVGLVAAAETGSNYAWALAGTFAGLAALTNFYGWIVVAGGAVIVILRLISRASRISQSLVFLGLALAIPAVWLVRDSVLLGDPLYPLLTTLLHDKGILPNFWNATEAQVRSTAEAYWLGPSELSLRLREIVSTLWNQQLLPTGIFPGVIALLYASRRRVSLRAVVVTIVALLVVVELPGWYFFRSLLPVLPLLAIGCALGMADLHRVRAASSGVPKASSETRLISEWNRLGLATGQVFGVIVVAVSSVVGISLAATAPNQLAGTPALQAADWSLGIRDLGASRSTLWAATGGDSLAWQWLNQKVQPGERFATLEARVYYLHDPSAVFYLDGSEAIPLVHKTSKASILEFLQSRRIEYIEIPGWADSSPVLRLLPLSGYLGRPGFPLVASFAPFPNGPYTDIYGVGSGIGRYLPAVYPGFDVPAPSWNRYVFVHGTTGVISMTGLPLPSKGTLHFEFRGAGRGTFVVSAPDGSPLVVESFGSSKWTATQVAPPTEAGPLSLKVTGRDLVIRDIYWSGNS